ncbi:MAG: Transcription antitermination protein RfaH [Anaerolineales bacterium]|nr:Transcription antitermination protein RfaH [Anaerolineales bacterium]
MDAPWYVLHSKPRKEEFLLDQLRLNKFTAYCPLLRVTPINPRARKVRPYFPGYVFVQADLTREKASSLQWMPGATGFVAFDGAPARVPDGFMPLLRQRVDEINASGGETLHEIRPGDTVRLVGGMFAGYEAVFDARLPGSERVRVLVHMLQRRALPVELPAGQVKKKPGRS